MNQTEARLAIQYGASAVGLVGEMPSGPGPIPDALIAAIVRAESNFQPVAVSEKSATGLMQLIPSTGMEHGVQDLTDPRANVQAGARYLRRLTDQYGGNLSLTLAAYETRPPDSTALRLP